MNLPEELRRHAKKAGALVAQDLVHAARRLEELEEEMVNAAKQATREEHRQPLFTVEQKFQQALRIAESAQNTVKALLRRVDTLEERIRTLEERTEFLAPR